DVSDPAELVNLAAAVELDPERDRPGGFAHRDPLAGGRRREQQEDRHEAHRQPQRPAHPDADASSLHCAGQAVSPERPMRVPRCLTIAGSDSGGGAGIQADLKAFAAAGCHGSTAIVALTAQNTVGVTGVFEVPPEFVRAQLEAVFSDIGVDAAKTGMLFSAPIIETVADFLAGRGVPLVVDPVMVASSGARLLRDDAVDALVGRLFPLATVVTPNVPEAEELAGTTGTRHELA